MHSLIRPVNSWTIDQWKYGSTKWHTNLVWLDICRYTCTYFSEHKVKTNSTLPRKLCISFPLYVVVYTCVLRMCIHEYAYIVNRLSVRLTLVRAKRTPVQRTVTNDDADKETHDCEPLISTWTYASRTRYQSLCVRIISIKKKILNYLT